MRPRTPIFIVTSSRPRVGKTLIARTLIEYFCTQNRPVEAFDVNPDEFTLLEHLPFYAAAASLRDTRGEMALFDQLVMNDQAPKVVDLGHVLFDRFFGLVQQIGFAAEAQRRGVAPMVLFVADPDDRARQGYMMLADRFPDLALVPVLNEAILKGERVHDSYQVDRESAAALQVPLMPPVLKAYADQLSQSLAQVRAHLPANMPKVHALELRSWTRGVFLEFREFELRLTLEKLRTSLQT